MSKSSGKIRQAVVLAGGFGTRLGELTRHTPKPLLMVHGKPFLTYLIEQLAKSGIEHVIVSTGYLPETFSAFIQANRWRDPYGQEIKVEEFREHKSAGTAGALRLMSSKLDERFLLVNGDTYFDCDLVSLLRRAADLDASQFLMLVREVPDADRYGRVELDADDRVTVFAEKSVVGPGLINAGIAVISRIVLSYIDKVPCSIEQSVYPRLAQEGLLHAQEQGGYFVDIGLPETYEQANREFTEKTRKPAVFFDRDGVLNQDIGYTHSINDFHFVERAPEAVKAARAAGYKTIVVTNQAGVARGYYSESDVLNFHRHLNCELFARGTWIDAFYYCPFHPDGTVEFYRSDHKNRKPNPGMIVDAAADLNIDLQQSFLVGDKVSDIQAAERAGIEGFLYSAGALDTLVASLFGQTRRPKAGGEFRCGGNS